MKIKASKEEQIRLKEVLTKHKGINEGIVKWLFNKLLLNKIKGDSTLMGKLNAADKAMDTLKDTIADRESKGLYVAPELKAMVGLK
jgi:hypothetical protein